jgi:hypothetical protein
VKQVLALQLAPAVQLPGLPRESVQQSFPQQGLLLALNLQRMQLALRMMLQILLPMQLASIHWANSRRKSPTTLDLRIAYLLKTVGITRLRANRWLQMDC